MAFDFLIYLFDEDKILLVNPEDTFLFSFSNIKI